MGKTAAVKWNRATHFVAAQDNSLVLTYIHTHMQPKALFCNEQRQISTGYIWKTASFCPIVLAISIYQTAHMQVLTYKRP